jgi:hypothetical protein
MPESRWIDGPPEEPGLYWVRTAGRETYPAVSRAGLGPLEHEVGFGHWLGFGVAIPGETITHHMPLLPPDPPGGNADA